GQVGRIGAVVADAARVAIGQGIVIERGVDGTRNRSVVGDVDGQGSSVGVTVGVLHRVGEDVLLGARRQVGAHIAIAAICVDRQRAVLADNDKASGGIIVDARPDLVCCA